MYKQKRSALFGTSTKYTIVWLALIHQQTYTQEFRSHRRQTYIVHRKTNDKMVNPEEIKGYHCYYIAIEKGRMNDIE